MAKVLNQLLYSSVVFGSDLPNGILRLESTSSGTKGGIEFVGSHFDFITDSKIGRFIHSNTDVRTYNFPDYSGQVLVSGIFTDANQIIYSSSTNSYNVLHSIANGTLVTDIDGIPTWKTGADGQILTIVSGSPTFTDFPEVGYITTSGANNLAYYASAGNTLSPIVTEASRILGSSPTGIPTWILIKDFYLSTTGNIPLTSGAPNQILSSDGSGNFIWKDPSTLTGQVLSGVENFLSYYPATGTTLDDTSFLSIDNTLKILNLLDGANLRIYSTTGFYTGLRASDDVTSNTTLILPSDLPTEDGYVLTGESDGSLHFKQPSSDIRWEQRGNIVLSPNMRSVTVLYDSPFSQKPDWIDVQWVIGEDSSYLPTYAVEKSTEEGFIVRFSTSIPNTGEYKLNWQSYLIASMASDIGNIYLAGGRTSTGYLNTVYSMQIDTNTISSIATLSSLRSYTCGGSSSSSGYIFGGSSPTPLALAVITSFTYNTSTLNDLSVALITARSGAASVGLRSKTYVAGGQIPSGTNYLSIEAFDTVTETISSLGSSLTNPSVSAGSATSYMKGAIVNKGLGTLELLTYATEVLNASSVTFGDTNISVGANDASNNKGYFGRDTGILHRYDFDTDTLSLLASTLNSNTGLSSASNSLDNAYFTGTSVMESLDFSTDTITTISTLPLSGLMSASVSTFQSKGLL